MSDTMLMKTKKALKFHFWCSGTAQKYAHTHTPHQRFLSVLWGQFLQSIKAEWKQVGHKTCRNYC